jgi:hypothetical protein
MVDTIAKGRDKTCTAAFEVHVAFNQSVPDLRHRCQRDAVSLLVTSPLSINTAGPQFYIDKVKFAVIVPNTIDVSIPFRRQNMKLKKIGRGLIILVLMIFMAAMGIVLGNYNGYTRGYNDGQKVTNTWWINKQSRYYDSVEVEKKRQSHQFNLL